jgi:NitT/TauT family transport system permease protein
MGATSTLAVGGRTLRGTRRGSNAARAVARAAVVPIAILIVWQLLGPQLFSSSTLPTPGHVVSAMGTYMFGVDDGTQYSGTFLTDFKASLVRVLGGFAVAAVIGVPLGVLLGANRRVSGYIEPTIHLFRSVPGICWLPLALIWFGFGTKSAIFLVSLGAFFPIVLSTIQGVRYVDGRLVRAARSLGASRRQVSTSVVLPAAMPSILNGLRIGLAYSWIYMILGEFTGVNEGLGASLLLARQSIRPDIIVGLMFVIGMLGVLSDWPIQWVLRRLFRADVAQGQR